jgi:hypothetical protein
MAVRRVERRRKITDFRPKNLQLPCCCSRADTTPVRWECVTVFRAQFFFVSVGPDTMLEFISHVLLQFVQGHTRRKPVTQSFRSVSDR